MKQMLFITGTDTGVGKTVLTALLVKFLRERGVNAAALKPICSGSRDDARKIFAAMLEVQSPKSKVQSLRCRSMKSIRGISARQSRRCWPRAAKIKR